MFATILQLTVLPEQAVAELGRLFRVVRMPTDQDAAVRLLEAEGASVQGIATTGKGLVDDALLDRLPNLKIIASYSAGLDRIDTAAAQRRGIKVTNTSTALADDVADLAISLILAHARRLFVAHAWVQAGEWTRGDFPMATSLRGKAIGIVGLGHIGSAVARRAVAFGMEVRYFGPRSKPEVPYLYYDDLRVLAAASDFLIVTCPATPATHHMVDASVLAALGSDGWLINVARASVVDEPALITALAQGGVAGAGLDVCEGEPEVAPGLLADPRVVVLPHIGSATVEARRAMTRSMIEALTSQLGSHRDEESRMA